MTLSLSSDKILKELIEGKKIMIEENVLQYLKEKRNITPLKDDSGYFFDKRMQRFYALGGGNF